MMTTLKYYFREEKVSFGSPDQQKHFILLEIRMAKRTHYFLLTVKITQP